MSQGRSLFPDILDAIASDGMRNAMIMEKVAELISRGHEKGARLRHRCPACPRDFRRCSTSAESNLIASPAPPRRLKEKRAISRFKRDGGEPMVLCNFGVLTTGFDAPRTSAAVIARQPNPLSYIPKWSAGQSEGRKWGDRKGGDLDRCGHQSAWIR